MRIVTGTFSHETNTFSNIPTSMEEFAKQRILHGADIPRRFRGTNAIEAAFLDAAEQYGFELIWTVYGSAIPGGKVTQEAYEYFSGHLLEVSRLRAISTACYSTCTVPWSPSRSTTARDICSKPYAGWLALICRLSPLWICTPI